MVTLPQDLDFRGRRLWGRRLPRTTATLVGALAPLMGIELVGGTGVTLYDATVVGAITAAAVVAQWLWSSRSFELRVVTVVLVSLILVGQVLASTFGAPGSSSAHWHPAGVAVACVAVAVVLLVVADALAPTEPERSEHPYAL